MPFSKSFDNVYKLAIKQAADAAGAFALRLDEQMYGEGMLERIYMEIGKADVLVADMTGHNPNVFYEVGYSHALNKVTLLITQNAADIPFDLKHRPHIIYSPDDLADLVSKLTASLRWGIQESRNRGSSKLSESFRVFVGRMAPKYEALEGNTIYYRLRSDCQRFQVQFLIKNESPTMTGRIYQSYIFARQNSKLVPHFAVMMNEIPMDESFSEDGSTWQEPWITSSTPFRPERLNTSRSNVSLIDLRMWSSRSNCAYARTRHSTTFGLALV